MTARIDRLWPDPAGNLTDDDLVADLGTGVRVNFVESVDGSATRDGLSGGLSGAADKRHFELLRRVADAVVVGAGTVRAEGYGPLRVSQASVAWRRAHGMPEHPVFVIVSGGLDLDPRSRVFTEAAVRPVVITREEARAASRFEDVATVIRAGKGEVDLPAALDRLRDLGLRSILCEGGPSLFGSLLAVDAVGELCVTVAPTLEAEDGPRIAHGEVPRAIPLRLVHVLRSGDALLLRYRR